MDPDLLAVSNESAAIAFAAGDVRDNKNSTGGFKQHPRTGQTMLELDLNFIRDKGVAVHRSPAGKETVTTWSLPQSAFFTPCGHKGQPGGFLNNREYARRFAEAHGIDGAFYVAALEDDRVLHTTDPVQVAKVSQLNLLAHIVSNIITRFPEMLVVPSREVTTEADWEAAGSAENIKRFKWAQRTVNVGAVRLLQGGTNVTAEALAYQNKEQLLTRWSSRGRQDEGDRQQQENIGINGLQDMLDSMVESLMIQASGYTTYWTATYAAATEVHAGVIEQLSGAIRTVSPSASLSSTNIKELLRAKALRERMNDGQQGSWWMNDVARVETWGISAAFFQWFNEGSQNMFLHNIQTLDGDPIILTSNIPSNLGAGTNETRILHALLGGEFGLWNATLKGQGGIRSRNYFIDATEIIEYLMTMWVAPMVLHPKGVVIVDGLIMPA